MRRTSAIRVLGFLLALLLIISFASPIFIVSAESPSVTFHNVTPRRGRPNIEYLFTAKYTDLDNDPPSYVKVFIDQVGYEMSELDPSDTNYTDGKDYFFKIVLDHGSYAYYFVADDGNGNEFTTNTQTLEVSWDVGHWDLIHYFEEEVYPGILMIITLIVVVILVLCFIMVVMALQMRKIGKALERRGEGEGKDSDNDNSETTQ
jgi:hypothetical protein